MGRTYRTSGGNVPRKPKAVRRSDRTAEEFLEELRAEQDAEKIQGGFDYRAASIELHGPVCARCGRDFSDGDFRQLTVHHKDFNHNNNPRDGSNWENLCIYCHEDVHSRHLVSDAIDGGEPTAENTEQEPTIKLSLADKLKEAMEKKKGD